MENIMIINEESPFREGLKSLIEMRFGNQFNIFGVDSDKLTNLDRIDTPRLLIVENRKNPNLESFITSMRKKGAKVLLLGNHQENMEVEDALSLYNGFLIKNMPTYELLDVIDEVIEQDRVYVHPEIGYYFMQKLLNRKK